jgi:hypothetical protein
MDINSKNVPDSDFFMVGISPESTRAERLEMDVRKAGIMIIGRREADKRNSGRDRNLRGAHRGRGEEETRRARCIVPLREERREAGEERFGRTQEHSHE